jgi:TolB-like protein
MLTPDPEQVQRAVGARYEVLDLVAAGGMGAVFRARHRALGHVVAIKVLPREIAASRVRAERFRREAQLAAHLSHPNVVPVYEFESREGLTFLVMPFVRGRTLEGLLNERPRLPLADLLRVLADVGAALDFAHARGVVHRDVKPGNILVEEETRRALLTDFGVALARLSAAGSLTVPGTPIGTPAYMAPEQVNGAERVDGRADLYALALVAYEALTGALPSAGVDCATLATTLHERRGDVTLEAATALVAPLAERPLERPVSAAAWLTRIRGTSGRRWPRVSMRTRVVTAGAIVALAVGGVATWRTRAGGPTVLAVLPFDHQGPSDVEYFADGLTDAISGKLASLPGLAVIDQRSSAQYKGTTKPPKQIGQELGAEYLLSGTVRWAAGPGHSRRAQIMPRLIRARDATTRWAGEPVVVTPTDPFKAQSQIAESVAVALRVALAPADQQRLARRPTENAEAYDRFLRGLVLAKDVSRSTFSVREIDRAADDMERAVRLDSTFALAWAWLGGLRLRHASEVAGDRTSVGRGKQALNRAILLEPGLAVAHEIMGHYLTWFAGDRPRGEREFRRAAALDPNDADILVDFAEAQFRGGQVDSAFATGERAVRLSPRSLDVVATLADWCARIRRWDEAERYTNRTIALDSSDERGWRFRLFISRYRGDTLQMQRDLPAALQHAPSARVLTAMVYAGGEFARRYQGVTPEQIRIETLVDSIASYYDNKADLYTYLRQPERMRAYKDSIRLKLEGRLLTGNYEPLLRLYLADAFGALQRPVDARRQLANAQAAAARLGTEGALDLRVYAGVLGRLGDPDSAVAVLERLLREPQGWTAGGLAIEPKLYSLHGNPRFERLVAGR